MKRYSLICPNCNQKMSLAIPEVDDNVNGLNFDYIVGDDSNAQAKES